MSWHTTETTSTTQPLHWHHYSELVVPMFLVLCYKLQPLYLLDSCFIQKPKHPP